MTAIDRTAYPRPGTRLTREELGTRYALSEADLAFVNAQARGDAGRLLLAVQLKLRQDFGCFPPLDEVHAGIVAHLATQLGVASAAAPDWPRRTKSLYRYQAAVRAYLSAIPFDDAAERMVADTVLAAAETMSDPADLISRAMEALQTTAIDLPAFSTLDRLVARVWTALWMQGVWEKKSDLVRLRSCVRPLRCGTRPLAQMGSAIHAQTYWRPGWPTGYTGLVDRRSDRSASSSSCPFYTLRLAGGQALAGCR